MFQEVELYEHAMVVYSLGNFVFLSPGRYVRKQVHPYSVALRLDFELQDAKPAVSATFYLLASNNEATQYRPYLLEGAEFSRAAELLLSGGTPPPRARARLKSKARFGRDRVGQHLRIELGPFGELPQQSHRRVNRAGAAPVRRSRAP